MALDREVLVLQPAPERSGVRIWDCQRSDWVVVRHSNLDAAGTYLTSSGTSVAILDCRGIDAPTQKLKRWMDGYQGVFWVAILSPNQLLKEEWQLFVATYCYDYHTSPVIDNMLAITLGRAYGMSRIRGSLSLTFEKQGLVGSHEEFQNVLIHLQAFQGDHLTLVGEKGVGKKSIATCLAEMKGLCLVCVDVTTADDAALADLLNTPTGASGAGVCLYFENAERCSEHVQDFILSHHTAEKALFIYGLSYSLERASEYANLTPALLIALRHNVVKVPALRERGKDKLVLAKHYLHKIGRSKDKFIIGFTSRAERAIEHYDWPGNIDELIACVKQGVDRCNTDRVSVELMGINQAIEIKGYDLSLRKAREEADALAIERVLELVSGSTGKAAELLCISRASLHRLIARYGIRR